MNPLKKHGWPFWIAVALIALPVLYVGSFGPACWITSRTIVYVPAFRAIYRPIDTVVYFGPYSIREFFEWYAELFAAEDSVIFIGVDGYNDSGRQLGPNINDSADAAP